MANEENLIKIDDDYTLEPDTACWALHFRREGDINPATGKPTLSRDDTYYPNLGVALKAYIDLKLRDCSDLNVILARLHELHQHIDKIMERYAGLYNCTTCGDEVFVTKVQCPACLKGKLVNAVMGAK